MNDVDYYDDNGDDNDDVRLNDVDDVVFPFYFFLYFISEGMEWRGGGKVQDLILSIYIHRHTVFLVIWSFFRETFFFLYFHFLFWKGTNQEKGKVMTINIIGIGRV